MNNTKKALQLSIALCFFIACISCNNGTSTDKVATDTAKAADTTAMAKPAPAPMAPAAPFDVVEIRHKVKDYAKWRPVFDADSAARKAAGLETIVVGKVTDNPNDILLVFMASDLQKAKAFGDDPKLKEAMDKGGVISKPVFMPQHVIRFNADSKEKNWVEISHKVKDFNTWLKAYDAEGVATRTSEGFVDVAITRGAEDSNMVHVVLDIKDMAKAKQALTSDSKKKIMKDAGVIGMPKIEYFSYPE